MNDQQTNVNSGFGNIDQIREILFGSQLQTFNNRIEALEGTVKTLQADTDSRLRELQNQSNERLDKVQQAFSAELQNAVSSLSAEIQSLRSHHEEDSGEVSQNLDRLSKRLSTNIATLDETIDKQSRSLRDDLLSSHRRLQNDLLNLRQQLFEDVEKRLSDLTGAKLAREDMADLLFELALKIKGTNLNAAAEGEAQTPYLLPEEKTEEQE